MKLSIVIPHYKEPQELVNHLLCSIKEQILISEDDYEVIVVNDGPESHYISNDFKIKHFNSIKLQTNQGVSVARNAGITSTVGEYLMFCDADDSMLCRDTLWQLLQYADGTNQMITSKWASTGDNKTLFYKSEYDATCIHSKLFLRSFLDQYHIRFPEDLTCHEDSYFVGTVYDLADHRVFLPQPLYFYGDNPDSLTRANNNEKMHSIWSMFHDSVQRSFNIIEHYKPELMPEKIVQYSIYSFLEFMNPRKQDYQDNLNLSYDKFCSYIQMHREQLLNFPIDRLEEIYNESLPLVPNAVLSKSYRQFIYESLKHQVL